MSTLHQLVSRNIKYTKKIRCLVPALKKCPQKRGVVQKIIIQTPKKPNSAKRKVAKVKSSTGRVISCYIPGIGHRLTKHSVVLVRGGRVQDLIGVRYKPIFGKFDFGAAIDRLYRFSKFGLSRKQFYLENPDKVNKRRKKKMTDKERYESLMSRYRHRHASTVSHKAAVFKYRAHSNPVSSGTVSKYILFMNQICAKRRLRRRSRRKRSVSSIRNRYGRINTFFHTNIRE
jgi:small subunit ribosomal protein S12